MATMFEKMQSKYRAARKVTRLYSGHMTSGQVRDVASWKQGDEELQQDFLDIVQGLADMEALQDDPEITAMVEAASAQDPTHRDKRVWPIWAAAAVLVLAVGLAFNQFDWGSGVDSEPAGLRYITRVGEQKTINLEDGSTVTLNTGTELLVRIDDQSRRLELRRGEAYFDVAPEPGRPFRVDLGRRSVTVLGTEFNILKAPERLTVAVLDGVISLHNSELEVVSNAPLLSAPKGEQVQISEPQQNRIKAGWVAELDLAGNQLTGYAPENIEKLQSWRSGQLRFDEEPLSEVIRQLNRYSAKKILIEDASIMNLKVYAVMRIDRIDLALTSLEKTLPVKVVRHFDRTILIGR